MKVIYNIYTEPNSTDHQEVMGHVLPRLNESVFYRDEWWIVTNVAHYPNTDRYPDVCLMTYSDYKSRMRLEKNDQRTAYDPMG